MCPENMRNPPVEMEWSNKKWEEVLFQDTESQQAVLEDTDKSEERPAIRRLEAHKERCPQRVKVKNHQPKATVDSGANVNYAR